MGPGAFGYLAFGVALVVLFALIFKHYYAKNRRANIEEAKYRMLDDDDERPGTR